MKFPIIYLICLLCYGVAGCSKDHLELYDDEASGNSIYFPLAETTNNLDHSFGYDKTEVTSKLLRVVVRTIGSVKDYDRPYKLIIADSSTMVKEVDYKILNTELVIRKGRVDDTLNIQLNRTAGIKAEPAYLYFELLPNEHFTNKMQSATKLSGGIATPYYFTRLRIKSDDIAGPPPFWMSSSPYFSFTAGYLGSFSSLKFQLLINRFNLDVQEVVAPNWFITGGNYFRLSGWGFGMQAWLDKMEAENNTVYEADGITKMIMGPNVQ